MSAMNRLEGIEGYNIDAAKAFVAANAKRAAQEVQPGVPQAAPHVEIIPDLVVPGEGLFKAVKGLFHHKPQAAEAKEKQAVKPDGLPFNFTFSQDGTSVSIGEPRNEAERESQEALIRKDTLRWGVVPLSVAEQIYADGRRDMQGIALELLKIANLVRPDQARQMLLTPGMRVANGGDKLLTVMKMLPDPNDPQKYGFAMDVHREGWDPTSNGIRRFVTERVITPDIFPDNKNGNGGTHVEARSLSLSALTRDVYGVSIVPAARAKPEVGMNVVATMMALDVSDPPYGAFIIEDEGQFYLILDRGTPTYQKNHPRAIRNGEPAWTPILRNTLSGAIVNGTPRLFDGTHPELQIPLLQGQLNEATLAARMGQYDARNDIWTGMQYAQELIAFSVDLRNGNPELTITAGTDMGNNPDGHYTRYKLGTELGKLEDQRQALKAEAQKRSRVVYAGPKSKAQEVILSPAYRASASLGNLMGSDL